MDADDISLSTRLDRQVAFMDAHPSVGVCGSWLETFGIPPKSRWCPPADDAQIRCEHLFHSVIYHPTVILRKDFFAKHNLSYNKQMTHAEDYDLWVRAGQVMHLANIPEILLHYRIHHDSVGKIYSDEQYQCSQEIRTRQLRELRIEPSDEEIRLHSRLSLAEFETSREFVKQAKQWLLKVQLANKTQGLFPDPVFSAVLTNKWFELCNSVTKLGFWVFRKFYQAPLKSQLRLPWKTQIKFFIKCVVKRPATLAGKSARPSKNV